MDDNLGQVVLVADINSGSDSSYPQGLIEFNDRLYFSADDGTGRAIWATDASTDGTDLAVDIASGGEFIEFNDKLYFSAFDSETGDELWATDGTEAGTSLVADINTNSNYSSFPQDFTEFNGKLYFSARSVESGDELWVSDSTSSGTSLVADINPGFFNAYGTDDTYPYGSDPRYLTEFNGKLYFNADDGENGTELWVSDGTSDGTQILKDINTSDSYDGNSFVRGFTEFNGRLYFGAFDEENGFELWVTDGTSEGTQLLKDINTQPSDGTTAPDPLTSR